MLTSSRVPLRISTWPVLLTITSLLSNFVSATLWSLTHQTVLPFLQDPHSLGPLTRQPVLIWGAAGATALFGVSAGILAVRYRPPLQPARMAPYAVVVGAMLGVASNLLMLLLIGLSTG
jgi:hypothetical protein